MAHIIDMREHKDKQTRQQLDEVMEQCQSIDKEAYTIAAKQAELLEYAIASAEDMVLDIRVDDDHYMLDIMHIDIVNEVYTMLHNLKKLKGDEPDVLRKPLLD